MDDAIKDISKGAVHSPSRLNHPAKLCHVSCHSVCLKVGSAARHLDPGHKVCQGTPVHQLEFMQLRIGGQTGSLGVKAVAKKLGVGGGTMKMSETSAALIPRSRSRKELCSTLERLCRAGRTQVNKTASLRIGVMMQRSGDAAGGMLPLPRLLGTVAHISGDHAD